jgi:hypothetical protein
LARTEVIEELQETLAYAEMLLGQCQLGLQVEVAQLVLLPERLFNIVGNRKGSYGGHPPPEVGDPDRFSYDANERLTPATRELFAYGKRFTTPNAIAVFVVGDVEYYIGEQQVYAGGLSFPPNKYHHPDDYPILLVVGLCVLVGSIGTELPRDDLYLVLGFTVLGFICAADGFFLRRLLHRGQHEGRV